MIILGIDPGNIKLGYGLLTLQGRAIHPLTYGTILLPSSLELAKRHLLAFEEVTRILTEYAVQAMAIETQFAGINIQSAMTLSMMRAILMLAATKAHIPIYTYSPTQIKSAVVGRGRASKEQMQKMIKLRLQLPELPLEDSADALAAALCHCQIAGSPLRL